MRAVADIWTTGRGPNGKISAQARQARTCVNRASSVFTQCRWGLRAELETAGKVSDTWRAPLKERFKVGDRVGWNSEAGHVSGTIIRVHTHDFDYKGHTHRASAESPQYEIRSSKTDHIAAHKGSALRRLGD
jgi:hypothetical protein